MIIARRKEFEKLTELEDNLGSNTEQWVNKQLEGTAVSWLSVIGCITRVLFWTGTRGNSKEAWGRHKSSTPEVRFVQWQFP